MLQVKLFSNVIYRMLCMHLRCTSSSKGNAFAKRGYSRGTSIASLTEELRRITANDIKFHHQLLDPMLTNHPSDVGIVSALAVTAAVIKVSSKPLEALVNVSKPWYRKTSFREAAMSIKSAALSAGNSPGGTSATKVKPAQSLYHQRVSSLKSESTKPGNAASMQKTNSQSVPVIQTKVIVAQSDSGRMTANDSFSSVVTSPSTESSLASPSSSEQLQPQKDILLKTLKTFRKEDSLSHKPEFKVTKVEDKRPIFDLGSDDDDSDADRDVKKPVPRCPVTRLNTLLNANIHQTLEGDAIRKLLAADPTKSDDCDDGIVTPRHDDSGNGVTLTATDSRIFTEQRPILTVEPPSPMPSFSLPDPNVCFGDATNHDFSTFGDETTTMYGGTNIKSNFSITNNSNSSNNRRAVNCDASSTVTFSDPDSSQPAAAVITNCHNTCSCNLSVSNKNKLTVPVIFDLVSLNLGKLTGERKACQRSHSASVHDQRRKVPAERSGSPSGVRCSSLSPANSFRSILAKRPFNNVPVFVSNPATNLSSSSPSTSFAAFHRSLEGDFGCPSYVSKFDDLPRNELDRPSPDQDLGCSPRGTKLQTHATIG